MPSESPHVTPRRLFWSIAGNQHPFRRFGWVRAFAQIALLFACAGAKGDSWHWVSRPLLDFSVRAPANPELVVRDSHGAIVSRSADCRLTSQDDDHWIAGRVPLRGDGPFQISLRTRQRQAGEGDRLLEEAVSAAPSAYDVVVLLDASHSMSKNDSRDLRKRATRTFCRLAALSPRIRRLSLVRFRKQVRVLVPPTPPDSLEGLDVALERLRPYSSTDFNPPFRKAADLLRDASDGRAVLFLSDGEPREDYRDAHRQLADLDCPVYTIGLSAEADRELLSRIARETGGQYFEAPAADELERIFHRVFRILSAPTTVAEFGIAAGGVEFVVDSSLTNPFLTIALRGSHTADVRLDGEPLQGGTQGVFEHPLLDARPGTHRLELPDNARAAVVLRAETDLGLDVFALNRTATRGTDLVFGFFVRNGDRLSGAELRCELRNPGGGRERIATDSTEFGLHTGSVPAPEAGRYRVIVECRGRRRGQSVYRRRELVFVRTSRNAPVPASGTNPQPVRLARQSAELQSAGLRIETRNQSLDAETGLQATFQTEPRTIVLDLPPGGSEEASLSVRLDGGRLEPVSAAAILANEHVNLAVAGTVQPNRPSQLTVSARADPRSAGVRCEGRIRVTQAERTWHVPVAVRVARPKIAARFDHGAPKRDGEYLSAEGTLTVSVVPEGRCEVRVGTEDGPWNVSEPVRVVGSVAEKIPLVFRARLPSTPSEWSGRLVASGPGLETVAIPWRLAWIPAAAGGSPETAPPTTPHAPDIPWLWLVCAVAALLVLLLVMTIRGSQRAAFLLVSAIIHLVVLFFTLPESTLEDIAESATMQPQTVAVGTTIVEERVAPESKAQTNESATPDPPDSPTKTSEPKETAEDRSRRVDTPTKLSEASESAEARRLHRHADREAMETDDLDRDPSEPIRKRHAESSRPSEAAETRHAPSATVVRLEDVAATLTVRRELAKPVRQDPSAEDLRGGVEKTAQRMRNLAAETEAPAKRKQNTRTRRATPAESATLAEPVATTAPPAAGPSRQPPLAEAVALPSRRIVSAMEPETVVSSVGKPSVRLREADVAPDRMPQRKRADAKQPAAGGARAADRSKTPASVPAESADVAGLSARALPTKRRAEMAAPGASLQAKPQVAKTATRPRSVVASAPGASSALPKRKRREQASSSPSALPPAPDESRRKAAATARNERSGQEAGQSARLGVRTEAGPALDVRPEAASLAQTPAPRSPSRADVFDEPETDPRTHRKGRQKQRAPDRSDTPMSLADATRPQSDRAVRSADAVAQRDADTEEGRALDALAAVGETKVGVGIGATVSGPDPRIVRPIRGRRADIAAEPSRDSVSSRRRDTHGPPSEKPQEDRRAPGTPSRLAAPPTPEKRKRDVSISPPRKTPLIVGGELADRPLIGRKSGAGDRTQGRWRRTFANFKHSGDWDCDRTAMLNLAHQVEQRTGSVLPFESRNVSVDDENLHKAPFLFMSGHKDFVFTDREVAFLRSYLKKGGALWINDSTDVDDETFDRAVRRELRRVMPDRALREIPLRHPIFRAPYDLTKGIAGFRVPPGDKYRQDYHEGIWLAERLAVVYTRNDYGDGLEIDAHTHALMPSLTDLTQGEMQEASVRMGANIALHFVQGGTGSSAKLSGRAGRTVENPAEQRRQRWQDVDARSLAWCDSVAAWDKPQGWDGPTYLPVESEAALRERFVGMRFRPGANEFQSWRAQATLARSVSMTLTDEHALILDVVNPMKGGARVAVAFAGPDVGYIESSPVFLRPGMNRCVAFDLSATTFKTADVQWQHRAAFPESMTVDSIFIIAYPQQPEGTLEFGKPRLAKP